MTDDDIGERLVDALGKVYGSHPGHRAAHAKGVLCAATFTPTPDAAAISRAPHFAGPAVRAHVRFSNGSGDPTVPDATRDGRGVAIKLYLDDGSTTDLVLLSLPVFFTRTPEDLLVFNAARTPDPATGEIDVAAVGEYLAEHPEAVPAVTAAMMHPIPASYATLDYHSLHAFGLVDGEGTVRHGRYHLISEASAPPLTDDEAASAAPDYLREELGGRLSNASAAFDLVLQVAGDGDSLVDPTNEWSDDNESVTLGRLELTDLAFDREHDGDVLVFDPTRVPDGLVLTDDPILHARSAAYRASVSRRSPAT